MKAARPPNTTITLTNTLPVRNRRPQASGLAPTAPPAVRLAVNATAAHVPVAASEETYARDGDLMYHLYLREIGQVKLLHPAEEIELAGRIRHGDEVAREQMIKANLRLVVKIAHDFDGYGLPLLDLISEGNIGLMKATDRFNPAFGAKFSTYAAWWIKQHIRRAVANQLRTIRLPLHAQEKLLRIQRAAAKLQEMCGREPADIEVARETGLEVGQVRKLRQAALHPVSLDESMGDDESSAVAEVVADENAADPGQVFETATNLDIVQEIFQELDPREKMVLRNRFGLDGGTKRSLEEIGVELGVTREYVRQIQNRALLKLRRRLALLEEAACAA